MERSERDAPHARRVPSRLAEFGRTRQGKTSAALIATEVSGASEAESCTLSVL